MQSSLCGRDVQHRLPVALTFDKLVYACPDLDACQDSTLLGFLPVVLGEDHMGCQESIGTSEVTWNQHAAQDAATMRFLEDVA